MFPQNVFYVFGWQQENEAATAFCFLISSHQVINNAIKNQRGLICLFYLLWRTFLSDKIIESLFI